MAYYDVVSEKTAHPKGLEPFLSRCVPDLHRDETVVYCYLLGEEVGSNCCLVLVRELLIDVLIHQ